MSFFQNSTGNSLKLIRCIFDSIKKSMLSELVKINFDYHMQQGIYVLKLS